MKKFLLVVLVPYLLIVGFALYIFFGPGLMASYDPISWNGIDTRLPGNWEKRTYIDNSWKVYSLKKLSVNVSVSVNRAMDVSGFAGNKSNIMFKEIEGTKKIFYIRKIHKSYQVVYAEAIGDTTVFFNISGGSVYSGIHVLEKITGHTYCNGVKLSPLKPDIPLSNYVTDLIFLGGMTIPFLLIMGMIFLSGMKPSEKHFAGESVRISENNVLITFIKRRQRKMSLCHLALTPTRLMIFVFRRPKIVIDLKQKRSTLRFEEEKNAIFVETDKGTVKLKPTDIQQWRTLLQLF